MKPGLRRGASSPSATRPCPVPGRPSRAGLLSRRGSRLPSPLLCGRHHGSCPLLAWPEAAGRRSLQGTKTALTTPLSKRSRNPTAKSGPSLVSSVPPPAPCLARAVDAAGRPEGTRTPRSRWSSEKPQKVFNAAARRLSPVLPLLHYDSLDYTKYDCRLIRPSDRPARTIPLLHLHLGALGGVQGAVRAGTGASRQGRRHWCAQPVPPVPAPRSVSRGPSSLLPWLQLSTSGAAQAPGTHEQQSLCSGSFWREVALHRTAEGHTF